MNTSKGKTFDIEAKFKGTCGNQAVRHHLAKAAAFALAQELGDVKATIINTEYRDKDDGYAYLIATAVVA